MSYNICEGRVNHSGQQPENSDERYTYPYSLQALRLQSHHA